MNKINKSMHSRYWAIGLCVLILLAVVISASADDMSEAKTTDVYIPKTGYVNAPVVVATPSSSSEVAYDVDGERPAVAILTVDEELNAMSNGVSYGKADELANKWQSGVIPAFRVTNEASASAVAKFFCDEKYVDSFIVVDSSDVDILKEARETALYSRGIIDFSNDEDITVAEITGILCDNSASVAIVPFDFSAEDINQLHARFISAWKYAEEDTYLSALYTGVNGIITDDYTKVYDIYSAQTGKVVTGKTLVNGHRGMPATYPENTLNGFLKAYEAGAEMLEIDLYISSDGHIVILHDDTVDRTTNGTGKIEEMTLAEIKTLTVDLYGMSETIPTLREVYATFKGKDVVLVLEIKTTRTDLAPKLAKITKEFDMAGQVLVMGATEQTQQVRQYMPEVPVGRYIGAGYGYGSDYKQLQIQTVPYNLQHSKYYDNLMNSDYSYNLAARGMITSTHTIGSRSVFDDCIISVGADCILTNNPEWGSDTSVVYELSPILETIKSDTYFTPKCKVNGTYKVVSCGIERTDGVAVKTDGNGSYCLSEDAEVVFYYDFSRVVTNGGQKHKMEYRIYSEPVVIKIATSLDVEDEGNGLGTNEEIQFGK